jgi:hypothetical protein
VGYTTSPTALSPSSRLGVAEHRVPVLPDGRVFIEPGFVTSICATAMFLSSPCVGTAAASFRENVARPCSSTSARSSLCEHLTEIGECLELECIAGRIEKEQRRLFAHARVAVCQSTAAIDCVEQWSWHVWRRRQNHDMRCFAAEQTSVAAMRGDARRGRRAAQATRGERKSSQSWTSCRSSQ